MHLFQAPRHKDSKSKVDIDFDYKSLAEFNEFKNMKDMIVGGHRLGYCEESPFECECEDESGQPCYILREVMHGDIN